MNIETNLNQFKTTDKKLIKRFYKAQRYSASLKGFDHLFITQNHQQIIAAVIISQIEANASQALLHGLVVDTAFKRKGIGKNLINFAASQIIEENIEGVTSIVCFADATLSTLYSSTGFKEISSTELAAHLAGRFNAYCKNQPNITIFSRDLF